MASSEELRKAKSSISEPEDIDPEYEEAQIEAANFKLELEKKKVEYRHTENMMDKKLGLMGRFLGGNEQAQIHIAFIISVLGIFAAVVGLLKYGAAVAEYSIAGFSLAAGALGYIFGQGRPR